MNPGSANGDGEADDEGPRAAGGAQLAPPLQIPMNPQHYVTFLAVIDAGGRLTAAAREIGMSQPGITHQLNELERRLNVRLLDRARGRPARLTRPGRVFERYARSIVQLQGEMYADLEQMSRRVGGHLRVGASSGPGEHWLPPQLCAFREEFPDLRIELHVGDARSIVESVFDHDFELGFVGGRWSRAGLQFDAIWRDEFVLIASPGHALARRGQLRLRDLAGVDFIAQEPGTGLRLSLEQELGDRDVTLDHFNVLAELGNQESVKSAVAAGFGVGCVWKSAVGAELDRGSLAVLDIEHFDTDSSFYVVRRASRRLSRRGQALLQFLQRARDERERDRRRPRPGQEPSSADDAPDGAPPA